jgi:DNA modification methylase
VDVIVTDIPYGVDLDNMEDIKNIDMMRSTHDVEENVDLMPKFLKAAYRVMKPNSYLLFFYALQHHEKLRDAGKDVGFKVQDWPLLWLKPHSCKNNAPQQNWTKSFEPMMVMKKGSPILPTPMTKCHLEVDGMPDKKMQSNPFAKPLLWLSEMVFKPLAFKPGSIMLDPFAGEGSILTAGVLHGLDVIGLELDTERFPALVSRMQRFYSKLLNNNVNFVLP